MAALDLIGAPQIAALLLLVQRGLEELYSARNTKALIALGAHEVGRGFYLVVAATHLAWIASLFFLVPDLSSQGNWNSSPGRLSVLA